MSAAPYLKTPIVFENEEILSKKEFKIKYFSDYINIIIYKTKNNIIIRSSYYELKLSLEDLSLLTKTIYKSIDESFEFINNIFINDKFKIKEINLNEIKIIIITYDVIKGKDKEIELCLKENFNNTNYLIKELFNKYKELEKEIINEKNNNQKLFEENNIIKNENINMKKEIEIIKNNNNIEINEMKMNIYNQIYYLQNQINQFIFQINQIKEQMNSILMNNNNYNIMNNNNYNKLNNNNSNFNNMIYQNNFNSMQNTFNKINLNNNSPNQNNSILINSSVFNSNNQNFERFNKQNEYIDINFRFSEFKEQRKPVLIRFRDNDLISSIIKKFRKETNFYLENVLFIFNAKELNPSLTANQEGLTNNNVIFVIPMRFKITFKISNQGIPITFQKYIDLNVSELINDYLDYYGINRYDIITFEYNSKILNENKTIGEELRDNSIIFIKAKKELKSIPINIIYYDSRIDQYINPLQMECLNTEKIKSLIKRYNDEFNTNYKEALFNSVKLDKNKRIEDINISKNSTIILKE